MSFTKIIMKFKNDQHTELQTWRDTMDSNICNVLHYSAVPRQKDTSDIGSLVSVSTIGLLFTFSYHSSMLHPHRWNESHILVFSCPLSSLCLQSLLMTLKQNNLLLFRVGQKLLYFFCAALYHNLKQVLKCWPVGQIWPFDKCQLTWLLRSCKIYSKA